MSSDINNLLENICIRHMHKNVNEIDNLADNILKNHSVFHSNAEIPMLKTSSIVDPMPKTKIKYSSISSGLCAMAAFSIGVDVFFALSFGISRLFCLLVVIELICCISYKKIDNKMEQNRRYGRY